MEAKASKKIERAFGGKSVLSIHACVLNWSSSTQRQCMRMLTQVRERKAVEPYSTSLAFTQAHLIRPDSLGPNSRWRYPKYINSLLPTFHSKCKFIRLYIFSLHWPHSRLKNASEKTSPIFAPKKSKEKTWNLETNHIDESDSNSNRLCEWHRIFDSLELSRIVLENTNMAAIAIAMEIERRTLCLCLSSTLYI